MFTSIGRSISPVPTEFVNDLRPPKTFTPDTGGGGQMDELMKLARQGPALRSAFNDPIAWLNRAADAEWASLGRGPANEGLAVALHLQGNKQTGPVIERVEPGINSAASSLKRMAAQQAASRPPTPNQLPVLRAIEENAANLGWGSTAPVEFRDDIGQRAPARARGTFRGY